MTDEERLESAVWAAAHAVRWAVASAENVPSAWSARRAAKEAREWAEEAERRAK